MPLLLVSPGGSEVRVHNTCDTRKRSRLLEEAAEVAGTDNLRLPVPFTAKHIQQYKAPKCEVRHGSKFACADVTQLLETAEVADYMRDECKLQQINDCVVQVFEDPALDDAIALQLAQACLTVRNAVPKLFSRTQLSTRGLAAVLRTLAHSSDKELALMTYTCAPRSTRQRLQAAAAEIMQAQLHLTHRLHLNKLSFDTLSMQLLLDAIPYGAFDRLEGCCELYIGSDAFKVMAAQAIARARTQHDETPAATQAGSAAVHAQLDAYTNPQRGSHAHKLQAGGACATAQLVEASASTPTCRISSAADVALLTPPAAPSRPATQAVQLSISYPAALEKVEIALNDAGLYTPAGGSDEHFDINVDVWSGLAHSPPAMLAASTAPPLAGLRELRVLGGSASLRGVYDGSGAYNQSFKDIVSVIESNTALEVLSLDLGISVAYTFSVEQAEALLRTLRKLRQVRVVISNDRPPVRSTLVINRLLAIRPELQGEVKVYPRGYSGYSMTWRPLVRQAVDG